MSVTCSQSLELLLRHGHVLLEGIFDPEEMNGIADRLAAAFQARREPSILRSRGQTYGSRNLLETFPEAAALLNIAPLSEFAKAVLGQDAGVVRGLYFDKPPDRSWSLPWHKDRTIAVKRNDLASEQFCKPTVKAGVPHVEAPTWLLEKMLTLRIHLDAMNAANGPLCVIPASHRDGGQKQQAAVQLHADVGDVLAMRPLLSHSSITSQPGTDLHRRVIHIELAQNTELPDGYHWYQFMPLERLNSYPSGRPV